MLQSSVLWKIQKMSDEEYSESNQEKYYIFVKLRDKNFKESTRLSGLGSKDETFVIDESSNWTEEQSNWMFNRRIENFSLIESSSIGKQIAEEKPKQKPSTLLLNLMRNI